MKPFTAGRWRRIWALLLMATMLLAACSSPPQPGVLASTSALGKPTPLTLLDGPAPASAAATSSDAPSQLVYNPEVEGAIEFWHFWGSELRRGAIRQVIAQCKQQLPNITVNEVFKPYGDIWTANITAVAAGSGMPDVIVEDRPKLADRAINGIIQPVTSFARRDGIDGATFWPFTWNETLYEGQIYGVPYETDVRVLYFNKNAFKEVGLDPARPPRTWEELRQYADKLDKKNQSGEYERIGFFPLFNVGADVWGYTNGVDWITDERRPEINTSEAAETLAWIKSWVDRYGGWQAIQDMRASFQAAPNDAFMSGRVAMFVDINGYSSQLRLFKPQIAARNGKTQPLEWGVTDLPYNKEKGSWSGGFTLSIPRGAQNSNAAWEFIKCATDIQAQTIWARETRAIPANQQAALSPTLMADPQWRFFVEAMSYTTGSVFIPEYATWTEQLDMRYDQIWRGELAPSTALEQAQQIVDQQFVE